VGYLPLSGAEVLARFRPASLVDGKWHTSTAQNGGFVGPNPTPGTSTRNQPEGLEVMDNNHLDYVSGYMAGLFKPDNAQEFVSQARRVIREENLDFDTIVVRGISGLIAGLRLADALPGVGLGVVRKPNENSHGQKYEGYLGERWLFVDDLVSSGATWWETIKGVHRMGGKTFKTQCIGALLYNAGEWDNRVSVGYRGLNSYEWGRVADLAYNERW